MNSECIMTIFTPTYNRAYILKNAYESLIKQNFKQFKWVIVDDGSTDGTKETVESWILENKIRIQYIYQKNQGRFKAFNTAIPYFEGELEITLDSDDYLLDNALDEIYLIWNNIPNKKNLSGIISYFEDENFNIIGNEFPKNITYERSYVLYDKYKLKGDKFMIFRIDIIKQLSYKIYLGERFGGDAILFNKINDLFPMYIIRKCFCHREYQKDSITNNLLKHHISSPKGIRDHYYDCIIHEKYNKINILKHTLGFISYSYLSNDSVSDILKKTNRKILTLLLIIPGYVYKCILVLKNNIMKR